MVRLVGVDLPRNKRIAYALTYIHGIGLTSAQKIIKLADISSEIRTDDLTTEQTVALRQAVEGIDLKLEGDLRRFNGLGTTSLLILVGVILDISREMRSILLSNIYNDVFD